MFRVKLVVKVVSATKLVMFVNPHWFFKMTTVSKNAVKVTSCQVPSALDVQTTVLDVLPTTNVIIARMASSSMEEPATLPAQPVLLPTEINSNVLPATSHAGPVLTIQAHVLAVNQEKVSCKSPEMIKSV